MKRSRILIFSLLLVLILLLSAGCQETGGEEQVSDFYIYFRHTDKTELNPVMADIEFEADTETLVKAVFNEMKNGADERNYISPIPAEVSLLKFSLEKGNLIFNFNTEYLKLSETQEIILRSALVKTMTQFEDVQTVEIQIENQPLSLSDGTLVGPESGDRYINPFDRGLNAYNQASTKLYFGSPDGTGLLASQVNLRYRNSLSLEQAVLEELLKGPKDQSKYVSTVPANTKILSVVTKDSVCYVNFDAAFLESGADCLPETTIYSIVNSLTEIPGINSVQISVNGTSNVVYLDKIDLRNPIIRDLNNVITEK